jgi:hypothetical protein
MIEQHRLLINILNKDYKDGFIHVIHAIKQDHDGSKGAKRGKSAGNCGKTGPGSEGTGVLPKNGGDPLGASDFLERAGGASAHKIHYVNQ